MNLIKNINFFKLSVYISISFLLLFLYKSDYLVIPNILNINRFIISFIFLFLGFIFSCENWRVVLKQDKVVELSVKEGIISNGLSIFTKYIPGKVLTVFSRALYVQKKYNFPIKKLAFESLKTQLISLWVGLIIGIYIFFQVELSLSLNIVVFVFIIFFSLFLFSKYFKHKLVALVNKFLKKDIDYPVLTFKEALKLLPSFFINWVFWCLGFYFLSSSIIAYDVSLSVGFSFALACVVAILALIAPGGIGVREGVLITILIGIGLEKQDAVSLSVISRLWFLVGEVFIFILASILSITDKDKKTERK